MKNNKMGNNKIWYKYPYYCLSIFLIVWVLLAINPRDRFTWFLENLLVFVLILLLILTFKRFRLSNFSYTLITIFLVLHTIGAHYTYSEVPFFKSLFDMLYFERDNYDRLAHFMFGLFMFYPAREVISRIVAIKYMQRFFTSYLSLSVIIAFSALYEIVEWITALIVAPENAAAFLGVQGDIFDAQRDMMMAISGALIAFIALMIAGKRK